MKIVKIYCSSSWWHLQSIIWVRDKSFLFQGCRMGGALPENGSRANPSFLVREPPRLKIYLYMGKRRLGNFSSSFLANKGKRESGWITCCSCWLTSSHGWGVRKQMTSYLLGIERYSLCRSGQSRMCEVGFLGPGSRTGTGTQQVCWACPEDPHL